MQCMKDTDEPKKCRALRDDYLECLHHRKEVLMILPQISVTKIALNKFWDAAAFLLSASPSCAVLLSGSYTSCKGIATCL